MHSTSQDSITQQPPAQQQESQQTQQQPFSLALWQRIEGTIYRAILQHPFLLGVLDGTLPESCFRYYIGQDVLYLR